MAGGEVVIPEREIEQVRAGEKTVQEVCEEFGVTKQAVSYRLQRYLRASKSFLGHIPKCTGVKCPIHEDCPFEKRGRCNTIHNFLKSIYTDWTDVKYGLGNELNQIQLDRIGTHIVPLYHQLARFSMEISALEKTTYRNKQGTLAAFPQFAELRAVITQIRAEMKDLKVDTMWEKKFGSNPAGVTTLDDIMEKGRPNAYEDLVRRAEANEKMRKKKAKLKEKDGKTTNKSG